MYPPLGPFLINMTRENLLDTKITNDKNKFPTLEFWEARDEVWEQKRKGLNKSKISCLINKVMAELKCLHNSSYLGLVYTWNFKGAINLLFFSQRLQQS